MSAQIQRERKEYYNLLESCQRGALDITPWIEWFLNCLKHAIAASEKTLESVLVKARFWETHAGEPFNERQRTIISRLLDGFEGKLASSKWAKLTKCSPDTALRDINDFFPDITLLSIKNGKTALSYFCDLLRDKQRSSNGLIGQKPLYADAQGSTGATPSKVIFTGLIRP
jgi:Fic family protein